MFGVSLLGSEKHRYGFTLEETPPSSKGPRHSAAPRNPQHFVDDHHRQDPNGFAQRMDFDQSMLHPDERPDEREFSDGSYWAPERLPLRIHRVSVPHKLAECSRVFLTVLVVLSDSLGFFKSENFLVGELIQSRDRANLTGPVLFSFQRTF